MPRCLSRHDKPLWCVATLHALRIGIWIVRQLRKTYCWPPKALAWVLLWTAAYPYEDRMEVVRRFTNMPENVLPLCIIPFGYPATNEKPKQKFDEKKIHYGKFQ